MQLLLTFSSKEPVILPLAYRQYIHGLIYAALSPEISRLHDGGYIYDGRAYKLFTFGQLSGRHTVKDKKIVFTEGIRLEIRSPEPAIIQALLHRFEPGAGAQIGKNTLVVKACELKDEHIVSSGVLVRAVSPIVCYITKEDGHTVFFSPGEKEFCRMLTMNAKRKYLSCHRAEAGNLLFDVSFEGGEVKKQVTEFKGTIITGYFGNFYLSGNPDVVDFLYNTGLGVKNSQGFGMFDLVVDRGIINQGLVPQIENEYLSLCE